jgi:ATP-binding cassette subfamily A (ABC1) protein 3
LSTHAAVQLAFDLLIAFQVQKHDFSFGNLRDSVENYNMTMALATTYLFNIWFYLLLGLYLDQVFPNEWGQRKHPLFCCIRRKPTSGPAHNNSNGPLSAFESVTRALKD